jgi:hypothetical protein
LRAEYQRDLTTVAARSKTKKVTSGGKNKKVKVEGPKAAVGVESDSGSDEDRRVGAGDKGPVEAAGTVGVE